MRYISGLLLFIIIFYSCSPTERIVEEEAEQEETTAVPDWYDSTAYSSADSLAVFGYALASSADSLEAVELSEETAINNLRFEIDKMAENARRTLISDYAMDHYSTPENIIQIRNSIQDLDLRGSELTSEHDQAENGIHYIYTRAAISRTALVRLLQQSFPDSGFIEQMKSGN